MREMDVLGVRVEMPANRPMLLLRESDGHRYLPIWIGAHEAAEIAHALEGRLPPRPLTHDLMLDVLNSLGHQVNRVDIVSLDDGIFYANLIVDEDSISARPSDAVGLAVRCGATIFCAEEVLDEAGIEVPAKEEDEVERFREFLDHVSADDFVADDDPDADDD